jgi:hypothetical protein
VQTTPGSTVRFGAAPVIIPAAPAYTARDINDNTGDPRGDGSIVESAQLAAERRGQTVQFISPRGGTRSLPATGAPTRRTRKIFRIRTV